MQIEEKHESKKRKFFETSDQFHSSIKKVCSSIVTIVSNFNLYSLNIDYTYNYLVINHKGLTGKNCK